MSRFAQVVAAASAIACVASAQAQAVHGLAYTYTSRTDMAVGARRDTSIMLGHGIVAHEGSRMDFDSTVGHSFGGIAVGVQAGSYLIASGDSRRMYVVTPASKQYRTIFDVDSLARQRATLRGSGIKTGLAHAKVDVVDLGAGPVISAHPTSHYQMTQTGDMNWQVLDFALTMHITTRSDYYFATDMPGLPMPIMSAPNESGFADSILGPELASQLRAAHAKIGKHGLALRTTITSTGTTTGLPAGIAPETGNTSSVIDVLLTSVRAAEIDPSLLVVPAGYTKAAPAPPGLIQIRPKEANTIPDVP